MTDQRDLHGGQARDSGKDVEDEPRKGPDSRPVRPPETPAKEVGDETPNPLPDDQPDETEGGDPGRA